MFDSFDQLTDDIEKAKEAYGLLEEVWHWHGPYGPRDGKKEMPEKLQIKLQRFFKFDDSE